MTRPKIAGMFFEWTGNDVDYFWRFLGLFLVYLRRRLPTIPPSGGQGRSMPPQDPPASPLQTPRLPLQLEDPTTPPDLVMLRRQLAGMRRAARA